VQLHPAIRSIIRPVPRSVGGRKRALCVTSACSDQRAEGRSRSASPNTTTRSYTLAEEAAQGTKRVHGALSASALAKARN
jgi:hypothetical protein